MRLAHNSAHGLALDEALGCIAVEEVEYDNGDVVVHAERERRGVHHLEALLERRGVGERAILLGLWIPIPSSGIKVTELSLGYEIIALFAEISIYSKFIQGGYGRIRSEQYLKGEFHA